MEKNLEENLEEDKKQKRKSKAVIIVSIILAVLIVAAGCVFFVLFFCNIENVTMSGNTIIIDEEIKQHLFVDEYDKNAVILVLKNKFQPRQDIPFVQSMDITMTDLNSVNIKIKEKEIIGFIKGKDKKRIYYNSEGIVQEISKVKVPGVPRIVNEGGIKEALVGSELPIREKSRRELLALQRELKQSEIKVSRIMITEVGNFILSYKDISIRFGTSSYMTEKVMRLKYILPKVKKKTGILHLEDWTEGNTDIIFEMTDAKPTDDEVLKQEQEAEDNQNAPEAPAPEQPADGSNEALDQSQEQPADQPQETTEESTQEQPAEAPAPEENVEEAPLVDDPFDDVVIEEPADETPAEDVNEEE